MKITAAVKMHSLKNKKMLSHAEFRDLARELIARGGGVSLRLTANDESPGAQRPGLFYSRIFSFARQRHSSIAS